MNKYLTFKVFIVLLISVFNASAIQLSDFIGSWSGKRKETKNGTGYYANIRIEGNYRADSGLLLVEKGKSSMIGSYTSKFNFYINGKYTTSATTDYGLILASGSGTWKKENGRIKIAAKGGNVDGPLRIHGNIKLISNKFTYISHNSNGTKVVITGNRR